MKAYTDLEQSKKLAEILPLESADMSWQYIEEDNGQLQWFCLPKNFSINENKSTPAWSLAALMGLMPSQIVENAIIYGLSFWKGHDINGNTYCFEYLNNGFLYETETYYNPMDAAVETVIWLKENKKI